MKTILITGSAGFIGTNLTKAFLDSGYIVLGIDNFSTSKKYNVEIFRNRDNYKFLYKDICDLDLSEDINNVLNKEKIDLIFNLACPASPPKYQSLSLETIDVCTNGLRNILEIAKSHKSKVVHASTSEVYGDPIEHPQSENYFGNVNTVGPRSCYDEGKRISETICYEYKNKYSLDITIFRIFNTYGPFMDKDDGRVMTNFINQALNQRKLTIYGDGTQTRSFMYIEDLIRVFKSFPKFESKLGPYNIGNPSETSINELADMIIAKIDKSLVKHNLKLPKDDPLKRRPDITKIKSIIDWEPEITIKSGLDKTIEYYKKLL